MDYGKFKYQEQKKAARGEAQAEEYPGQGSQVPAGHRRRRLQDQAAQPDRSSWTKATRPRSRCASAAARWRTRIRRCACWSGSGSDLEPYGHGRAVPEAGRPADDDGAGAEEEEVGLAREADAASGRRMPQPEDSTSPVKASPPEPASKCSDKCCRAMQARANRDAVTNKTEGAVMPKMKTKSGAKKRFRVRPGGTVKRGRRSSATSSPRRPPRTSASCAAPRTSMRPTWTRVARMMPFA